MHAALPLKFSGFFPTIHPWVANLANIWPATFVKPNFAIFEVFHILTLIMLGGASIIVGLRLIRSGVTDEEPSQVWRDMRLYLHIGIWGVFATGILIGMANAERLYDSAAFLAKMLCLAGGIILVFGSTRSIALADGAVSRGAYAWGIVGLLFWLGAILVFLTGGLITPGLYHMLTAAALIAAFVTRGRLRWIYLAGLAAILVAMFVTTHVILKIDDYKHADPRQCVAGLARRRLDLRLHRRSHLRHDAGHAGAGAVRAGDRLRHDPGVGDRRGGRPLDRLRLIAFGLGASRGRGRGRSSDEDGALRHRPAG